jgi:uncharacterized protein (TIGR02217 family)
LAFAFPIPTPVFPTLRPGFSFKTKPIFATATLTTVSGVEIRSAQQAFPLWEFEMTYELLADRTQNTVVDPNLALYTELQQISGLFLVCRGQYGRFFFTNPTDNSRTGQVIQTGDGVTTSFRVIRSWANFSEPVGAVNVGEAINVYLDDVLQAPSSWEINSDLTHLVFDSAPSEGAVITMDFFFYYFCRWLEDIQDYEQFFQHLWEYKSCKFRSTKR